MRKTFAILALFVASIASAQIQEFKPQITVAGEGKIKTAPDQALISIAVENTGSNATEVKKQNDEATEKVVAFLKKFNLPKGDVQTQRVSLNPQYDYNKKKYSHTANQTIQIMLKNLDQYDALMGGLVEAGITRVNGVTFKSSKEQQLESEARKLAMKDAKIKAEDYVSVLNQKIGKALTINDNSQIRYPQPVMYMAKSEMAADAAPRETVAIGEIEIIANVSVSFSLD
ncbi:MAG: DUF541 domain-containing protein [Proteobacteria bacterium]|nr:MAG: DUF541 domain-containing protein [Pseudomonadota bacterium]